MMCLEFLVKSSCEKMEKPVKRLLLEMLLDLPDKDLNSFKWRLANLKLHDLPAIRKSHLEGADRIDMVDLMLAYYTADQAVEVTTSILKDLCRNEPVIAERYSPTLIPGLKKKKANRIALLINNKRVKDLILRHGAEKEEQAMLDLLTRLGYEVMAYRDLSAKEMDNALIQFTTHEMILQTDSVFVVILSPGNKTSLFGTDGEKYEINNVYRHLKAKSCPALLNKPKIIIAETYRGDGAVYSDHLGEAELTEDVMTLREKDFVSLLFTSPDTASFRSAVYGSSFIHYVVQVFSLYSFKWNIEELFRKGL
ncbi:caspase a-like [Melanotaenia boesemani]|uniref:caspase a-like n=1 Tax=Melanotaenia boesemani TaxID=1250792 RepID=UPI001C04C21F|nr:caspase a-like [Melanotaenia boesemani]